MLFANAQFILVSLWCQIVCRKLAKMYVCLFFPPAGRVAVQQGYERQSNAAPSKIIIQQLAFTVWNTSQLAVSRIAAEYVTLVG